MAGLQLYKNIIKPLCGFAAAFLLVSLLLPLLIFIAALLYFFNGKQVFFTQIRIGYKERKFRIYKFKTMKDVYDENGNLLPDAQRQTDLGNFLRYYHLDELPQLLHVLKGDLQLIGPRPLLPEYLPFYTQQQRLRHVCRPGLVGLSQVKGGNVLNWSHRLRYDHFYASKSSFWLDMHILWLSFKYFFAKKSTSQNTVTFSESFVDYSNRLQMKSS